MAYRFIVHDPAPKIIRTSKPNSLVRGKFYDNGSMFPTVETFDVRIIHVGRLRVATIRVYGGNDGESHRNRRRLLQKQKRQRRACSLVSEALGHDTRGLWRRHSEMAG